MEDFDSERYYAAEKKRGRNNPDEYATEDEDEAISSRRPKLSMSESLKLDESLREFRKKSDPRYVTRLSPMAQVREIFTLSEEKQQALRQGIMEHGIINGWEGIVLGDGKGNLIPFSFDNLSIIKITKAYDVAEDRGVIICEPSSPTEQLTLNVGELYRFIGEVMVEGEVKETTKFTFKPLPLRRRRDPDVIYPKYIEITPFIREAKGGKSRRIRKGRRIRKSGKSRKRK